MAEQMTKKYAAYVLSRIEPPVFSAFVAPNIYREACERAVNETGTTLWFGEAFFEAAKIARDSEFRRVIGLPWMAAHRNG